MPNGETSSQATLRAFWEWAKTKYSPGEIAVIEKDPSIVLQFYVSNIQGTQWDVGVEPPLPRGRPQPEKYGINETDWLTLEMLGGNPARLQKELETWLGTGYINEYQARDIWDELNVRITRAATTLLATGYTEEEWPAEYQRRLKQREEEGKRAEQERLVADWRRYEPTLAMALRPKPLEYGPALEEMRTGFGGEVPQTERWRDWFRSKYPRLIEQFEAKVPEAERKEKTWAEYLKARKPEVKEQWYAQTPYERGERPSAFAPRVQTVGF